MTLRHLSTLELPKALCTAEQRQVQDLVGGQDCSSWLLGSFLFLVAREDA